MENVQFEECMTSSVVDNLFVLPSDVNLAGAEIELIGVDEKSIY